ncbi:MAG: hypothetical protein PHE17_12520 [Thiothrix sp.]|uniref:hypothetical protein n=1 Tax=Thiothrix sp. TaxID=1032 RepID=UPI00263A1DA6|nr:hypothetical protein [Thiothrix sp.]MDD5393835.1 hypothetical protein [Thiothrix sp.]
MKKKVLTLEVLKDMAGEIAELLLKQTGSNHGKVGLQVNAAHLEEGVRVQIEATSSSGQMLFAIQAELHGTWLEDATELSLRSVVFNGV